MTLWMQEEIILFRGMARDEFVQIAEWVVSQEMWPHRRKAVIAELEAYRQDGAKIILSSSAYQPITAAFGHQMAAEAIGSPLLYAQDKVSGVGLPLNAYEQKAAYIQQHYGAVEILAAYGDTASDIPMMELSDAPVAVFPSKRLRQVALDRGWRILEGG